MDKLKVFFKKVVNEVKKPEMRILPGQLAFFLLLSIIPLIAMMAAVASQFSLSIESLINGIEANLPKEISDFILQIINEKNITINIVMFIIIALVLASNGPHSMIIGSNMLYKIKNKDYLTRRIKAIFMTIILLLLLLFLIIVPAFGDKIIHIIIEIVPNNNIDNLVRNIYSILKYPLSLLIIFFFIKLLYTMAPDKKIPSSETTTGAIFTTIGWILSTEIYSFYVIYFAKYNILYGSVANLLILFIWIYLLAYIFVLGMALNASSHEED